MTKYKVRSFHTLENISKTKHYGGSKMIYYDKNKYKMSQTKVHYIESHEGEITKFIGLEGKDYWEYLSENDTIKLIGFIEVDIYSNEQKKRLDIINQFKLQESDMALVEEYILNNKFEKVITDEDGKQTTLKLEKGHPLYPLKLESELADTQNLLLAFKVNELLGGENDEFSL